MMHARWATGSGTPHVRGHPSAMLRESCRWNDSGPAAPFAFRLLTMTKPSSSRARESADTPDNQRLPVSSFAAIVASQKTSILAGLGFTLLEFRNLALESVAQVPFAHPRLEVPFPAYRSVLKELRRHGTQRRGSRTSGC